jgi:hypothetical protein
MPFREEKRYRVLRRGAEVARVEGVSHYTFDELVLLNAPRTINFYNASRELGSIVGEPDYSAERVPFVRGSSVCYPKEVLQKIHRYSAE